MTGTRDGAIERAEKYFDTGGFLDDLHGDWGSERFGVEDMLARAVAELAR